MRRLAPLAAALLLPITAHAAPSGYYVATPAAQVAKTSLMTRATPWRLQDGAYVAERAPERAETLCQLVARDVGQLSSFSAGGAAFDADALTKCNAHAKTNSASGVAAR